MRKPPRKPRRRRQFPTTKDVDAAIKLARKIDAKLAGMMEAETE